MKPRKLVLTLFVLFACLAALPAAAADGTTFWSTLWERVVAYVTGAETPGEIPADEPEIVHGVPVGG